MNERFEKLAMEANYRTGNEFDLNSKPLDALLTKFAELIIRECYNVAEEHDCNLSGNGGEILKHFGVE